MVYEAVGFFIFGFHWVTGGAAEELILGRHIYEQRDSEVV